MRLYAAGPIFLDGGTLFIVDDSPPVAGIEWSLTGNGVLTPNSNTTDRNGVATARYVPTGAAANDVITVSADVFE